MASDLRLPELVVDAGSCAGAEHDVRVVVDATPQGAATESQLVVEEGRCRFFVPEAGWYEVQDGRRIEVGPVSGATAKVVRAFVLGSAWAALLHQRGAFPMHAGVVKVGDGAVALCGRSGVGKSTAVACLARRGHRVVSDDLCRLEVPAGSSPQVWPSAPRLKLSHETLDAAGCSAAGLARELPPEFGSGAKFYVAPAWCGPSQPLPLRAIYVLEWGRSNTVRLRGMTALRRFLAAATYRPWLLHSPAEQARYWRLGTEVAQRVPVWELTRPREWQALEWAVDTVAGGSAAGR